MFQKGLSQSTSKNLALLTKVPSISNFYLAGGTACALHFGHRLSFDLDFFSQKSFDSKVLASVIKNLGVFSTERIAKGTLLGKLNGEKISFFLYQYPLLESPKNWHGITIASIPDLAAMKVDAVSNRGIKRDFIDLYWICQTVPLKKTIDFYDQKYQKLASNLVHIIKSLNYFADAEEQAMPQMLEQVSWNQVKDFFTKEVGKLSRDLLGLKN